MPVQWQSNCLLLQVAVLSVSRIFAVLTFMLGPKPTGHRQQMQLGLSLQLDVRTNLLR